MMMDGEKIFVFAIKKIFFDIYLIKYLTTRIGERAQQKRNHKPKI